MKVKRSPTPVADVVRSMDPRWGRIPEETPTGPSASGAFDNSPQFQLRVRRPDAKFVPTGRLKFVVVRALAGLKSHWFSRPCGTGVVGHPPPAVETAGYCQIVPAGRDATSRRGEAFLERRIVEARTRSPPHVGGYKFRSVLDLYPSVVDPLRFPFNFMVLTWRRYFAKLCA